MNARNTLNSDRQTWQKAYATRLLITDFIVTAAAVAISQFIWIADGSLLQGRDDAALNIPLTYSLLSAMLVLAWMLFLDIFSSRDHKNIGTGALEYRRIVDATVFLFGFLAIAAYLLKVELGRGYFLTALPLGLLGLLLTRWSWRQWLHRRQRTGAYQSRTLLVGQASKVQHIAEAVQRDGSTGLFVVGGLTKSGPRDGAAAPSVDLLGTFDDVLAVIDSHQIDTVVFSGADDMSPKQLRKLGWRLEERRVSLIVAPTLTDVAGPRIHARPVAGLPLIHVDFPEFAGRKQLLKRAFDVLGSSALILLSSPFMLAVAIAVRASGPGPIFFTQERIGLRGEPFKMLKFRSMVQGADNQLASLLDAQGTSDKPLFKVLNDPRITPVGRFIRKYSLDEFPQLLNVAMGEMSLVGPRPQRAEEVALYDDDAHRRLFVKPGMSGLWQVSGRSQLSWDDSIRLDLYYVENWSVTADIVILWRTLRAVVAPGADAH
ncbi:sugar transferase [Microterricola pindariensis]|uniref:Polyprenyl glycosylphosphotransferase n=1 Tax=Microterricola pindariensis TaxID=478010 RepID=A0ABX5ASQ5_9MICO|nr:sugar transferase [Microterricola pindariensis]PPL15758.1 polyprenyl glycosylphosphotransferase [Microterricola pindariensis]